MLTLYCTLSSLASRLSLHLRFLNWLYDAQCRLSVLVLQTMLIASQASVSTMACELELR
jgi:hypothetical protein